MPDDGVDPWTLPLRRVRFQGAEHGQTVDEEGRVSQERLPWQVGSDVLPMFFAGVSTPGRVDREVAIEVLRGAAFAAALEESDFDDSAQLAHALDAFTATASGPALSRS